MVIADGLNYIKGYRYQLWCEAKAAGTRCCVVHVAAHKDECKQWNEDRLRACGRGAEIDERLPVERDSAKQGKDVLGEMMPESHTAIYGDQVTEKESRSRSSSVDALDDADRTQPEDTMTLKSLYISDNNKTSIPAPKPDNREPQPEQPRLLPAIPIPNPSLSHPYAPSTLTSLIMRYEPPSPFSRWDTPLFTIPTSDAHPLYTDIWNAIFPAASKPTSKKALSQLPRQQETSSSQGVQARKVDEVRRHAATQLPRATSASALQILESTTLEIVKLILASARDQGVADGDGGTLSLSIPLNTPTLASAQTIKPPENSTSSADVFEAELHIPTSTILSQPMLQRLRRKYTQIQRAAISHGQAYAGMRDGRAGVVGGFVGFVASELGEGD